MPPDQNRVVVVRLPVPLPVTLGLILGFVVHQAGLQDRAGAKLLEPFLRRYGWLKAVFVDGGYAGRFLDWVAALPRHRKLTAHVVKRIHAHRFVVLPKRWIVERTFAWLGNFRRLSKDYKVKPTHSEAMIYLAASALMLRRLSKSS